MDDDRIIGIMTEECKRKLSNQFRMKNSAVSLTYEQWLSNREGDWKRILIKKRPELTKAISNDIVFFDMLRSKDIFNKSQLERFRLPPGKCAQISALLDGLEKRPFGDFVKFCTALIEYEQIAVIANFMAPELEQQVGRGAARDEADAVPITEEPIPVEVGFDWRRTMRLNFTHLIDVVDPDHGLLTGLRAKGVINDFNADVFAAPEGRTNRVAQLLDYIMLKRPAEDFVKLCNTLNETGQDYIVTEYLSPESLKKAQDRDKTDWPSVTWQNSHEPDVRPVRLDWKKILIRNHLELVDNMAVEDDLINELLKLRVINRQFSEILKEEKGSCERVGRLLEYMQRRSDNDYSLLRKALETVKQLDIVEQYLPVEETVVKISQQISKLSIENRAEDVVAAALCPVTEIALQPGDDGTPLKAIPSHPEDVRKGEREVVNNLSPLVAQTQTTEEHSGDGNSDCAPVQETQTNPIAATADEHGAGNFEASVASVAAEGCDPITANAECINVEYTAEQQQHNAMHGPVTMDRIIVQKCTRAFYEQNKVHAYPMSNATRGRCLIFNMETVVGHPKRMGTRIDGELLKDVFGQLHFATFEFMDYTAKQVTDKIFEVSRDTALQNDQCLVLFFMSHGTSVEINNRKTDCIYGSDSQPLTPDEILSPLTNSRCSYLKNKPKLVFFQACRGEHCDQTDATGEPATQTDYSTPDAPSYTDFLIGYPTQSSYRSFRDTERGAWYINALVRILMDKACSMDICAMLNLLNGQVSGWQSHTEELEMRNKTQIANYVSHLRKSYFYFFPGIQHWE
jgi:hypothetical protein